MNWMRFDAMAVGNHEFDKGPSGLALLLGWAQFPFLSANIDVSAEPQLAGKIQSYIVKELNGEQVGIIGLTTPETPIISSPGDNVVFSDAAAATATCVTALSAQGVNKIIVLSHMGYSSDVALAQAVDGIDVIVGGHSHTLLGSSADLDNIGVVGSGDYPTVATSPSGQKVYIVQAEDHTEVVGVLKVDFDANGLVSSASGQASYIVGDNFQQKDADGVKQDVDDNTRQSIMAAIASNPAVEYWAQSDSANQRLSGYTAGVAELQNEVVAQVDGDLWHIREPGTHTNGAALPNGSLIAPLVCDGMVRKVSLGENVGKVFALQNAGGVRIDITDGPLTVGTIYTLMPFGNTLVTIEVTGAQIKAALEQGVARSGGAWPYVGGGRYTVDMNRSEGDRVTKVEVKNSDGTYGDMDMSATFTLVTNSFVAGGGDGYTVLEDATGTRIDTGFIDAEALLEYAKEKGTLAVPEETGVIYIAAQ